MRIQSNEQTIKAILNAITDTILGVVINELYNYNNQTSEFDSYVEFSKKDGSQVNPEDTFWLGFYCKDYL